jgi:hypothetical protein
MNSKEVEQMSENSLDNDPHGGRMVGISIFPNKTNTTPCINKLQKWRTVQSKLMSHDVRTEKDGLLIGGYMTVGHRHDDGVKTRSLVQLDIDTTGEKDKVTDRVLTIEKAAPALDQIRAGIDAYEWVEASSHWHEPQRGVIKYRITALPDRAVQREEYEPLLEALNELLGGALDRGAWPWSQSFYLPSCPPGREGDAFAVHNAGALIPVDEFVERGRRIIAARPSRTKPSVANNDVQRRVALNKHNIRVFLSMLDALPDIMAADYDTWIRTGFAVHAFDSGKVGLALWKKFSMRCPAKAAVTDFDAKWAGFDRPHQGPSIGIGTLWKLAMDHGWPPVHFTVTL